MLALAPWTLWPNGTKHCNPRQPDRARAAQTHRWKLVDMASGAPLADIVADASISSMHISADEGGRLQTQRL